MDDESIVDLYWQRNQSALRYTKEKYGKSLIKIAQNVCQDHATAEECENDTYWEAWNSIPPHEPKTYLFAFLAKIVRAKALNRVTAMFTQKRNAELVTLSDELAACLGGCDEVNEWIDAKETGKAVSDFLRTISEEKRNIFLRRYWFMDSVSEISAMFSVSESKVKTVLFRTRNELKQYLKKEGFEI